MRDIHVDDIAEAVEKLCIKANYYLNDDIKDALIKFRQSEESPEACDILDKLLENAEIAAREQMAICQDTGMAVVFIEIGQDIHITGGSLTDAINDGVRKGYKKGYLRNSVINHPFGRINTGDNTPAIIHYDIVKGENIKITVAPKGFGSENMSGVKMLKPSEGMKGTMDYIVDMVDKAGANPCPPVVVGVGIGGTMEKAAYLSKRALLRSVGQHNEDAMTSKMEEELLTRINNLGIGPQGFGGRTTALAVNVETYPTHIAGLPVAVNIGCHVTRHAEAIL